MPLGSRLTRLREARHWSQHALALRSALSQSTIWQLEHEGRRPSFSTLQCLAAAFELPVDELVRLLDGRPPTPGG